MTTRRDTLHRMLAVTLAVGALGMVAPAGAAEPITVRIGFASVGADNRQFSGGSSAAVVHSERYLDQELRDRPEVKVEWYFFKGAGPAVNEAFANNQLDFALQGDLPQIIGRANGLKTKLGFTFRYSPAMLYMKEMVDQDFCGEPYIYNAYEQNSQWIDPQTPLRQAGVDGAGHRCRLRQFSARRPCREEHRGDHLHHQRRQSSL